MSISKETITINKKTPFPMAITILEKTRESIGEDGVLMWKNSVKIVHEIGHNITREQLKELSNIWASQPNINNLIDFDSAIESFLRNFTSSNTWEELIQIIFYKSPETWYGEETEETIFTYPWVDYYTFDKIIKDSTNVDNTIRLTVEYNFKDGEIENIHKDNIFINIQDNNNNREDICIEYADKLSFNYRNEKMRIEMNGD